MARLTFVRSFCIALLIASAATAAPARQQGRGTSEPSAGVSSRITITMPAADAQLFVDGQLVEGLGGRRTIDSRRHPAGTRSTMSIVAQWKPNGYTEITRTKEVPFTAGRPSAVDLSGDDPTDRVKIIYVPTPQDAAEEMARLAGVGPNDIVYEPGCGDARITIAAIRRGARRGICVDIDKDRVDESRANVKRAGLSSRIEVRHGDALDVKDLSAVTVVLLYMGEHFNKLLRPVLLRDLKPGSRIVSHFFTMGDDWPPEKTVRFASKEGGIYRLHLWTITTDVKKRLVP
jgi:uncharacterized protein (TIGR03000 family)